MIKKISDKDKKDWEKFVNSSEKLDNKDRNEINESSNYIEKMGETKGKWMTYYEKKGDVKQKSRVENFINYYSPLNFFLNNQISSIVNFINEDTMCLFKDKINWKLPQGEGFRAHQDYPAWADFSMGYLS